MIHPNILVNTINDVETKNTLTTSVSRLTLRKLSSCRSNTTPPYQIFGSLFLAQADTPESQTSNQ